jgi:hypothetical protein
MATQNFSGLFSSGDDLAKEAQAVLNASGKAFDPRFIDSIVGTFTKNGVIYNVLGDGSIQGIIETPEGAYTAAGYTPSGQQVTEQSSTRFEQTDLDRALGVLANAAIAAGTGLALGPAGIGFLGAPAAAATGAGVTNFANTGNLESALRAAALGGLSAYGADALLGSLGSGADLGTALDLTAADDIAQLASVLGTDAVAQNQIANIISNSYGVDPFTAASSVSATLGTGAATGVGAGAGTGGVAGQTVNVLGNTAGTGLGTAGTGLLGSVVGTGLTGTGTGTDTGTQTVNITGTGAGTGTGTGTGSVVGSTVGTGLGTGTGTGTGQTVTITGQGTGTGTGTGTGSTVGAGVGSLLGTGTGTGQTVTVTGTPTTTTTPSTVVGAAVPAVLTPAVPKVDAVLTPDVPKVEVVGPRDRSTCPAPEMLVTLADGTKKSAGELKEGDFVKTQHENTLEWGVYPVVYKELIPSAKRLKIVFDDTEFIGSYDHKFFVSVDNWKKAEDLKVGDIVSGHTIKSIQDHEDGPVVFITIKDAHSYICQDLLSHNKMPSEVVGSVVGSTVGTTGTTGTTTTTNTNNLSLADLLALLSLLNLGGTLGGTGTGTVTTGSVPPSDTMIGSTTPQFGPDYYAAVQRYYNAYMPETPRNVAGPLQQWYENKYGA